MWYSFSDETIFFLFDRAVRLCVRTHPALFGYLALEWVGAKFGSQADGSPGGI